MSEIREHPEHANKGGTNWKSLLKGFVPGAVISSILLIALSGALMRLGGIFLLLAPPIVFLIAIVAVNKKRNSFGVGVLLGSLAGIIFVFIFYLVLFLKLVSEIDFN